MLIIVGTLLVGIILSIVARCIDSEYEVFTFLGQFVVYAILGTMLIVLAVNHANANAYIIEYEEIKRSIEEARNKEISEYERATLTERIIDVNTAIASNEYWNETLFDIFIPDKILKLEKLK